ncbi:MAG: DUF411 domain-containing protein [Paracoccus sp. (in: a-proteobacteria)]|uniref:DUF411 domain-containing protein n=1 Tax=Paracoccus sp. TaxID=267 RepID=UPI0026E0E944|nr:DUF411 domain-containing protein [Paracoccus sp. (in: a-proteobacteria)]MDO5620409.1 DUF411 domain-containing protein [Paracoccus sp. (in: a-proteobacteria)]
MLTALPVRAKTTYPAFHVVKDPNCGCCGDWIALVEQAGFPVTVEDMPNDALARLKAKAGIPPAMTSCHTARVEGYVIEGHVPLADIRRLLDSRPDAIGLSVPGMPWGSPGMGPEAEREAYDVHLIRKDGTTRIFNHYPAA